MYALQFLFQMHRARSPLGSSFPLPVLELAGITTIVAVVVTIQVCSACSIWGSKARDRTSREAPVNLKSSPSHPLNLSLLYPRPKSSGVPTRAPPSSITKQARC
ncbi:hypothetical protein OG21DRAFT_293452 [Imleria badia]|nr:hypothetical protein OG21DRAFT_293452 [Imleria badia]